MKTRSGLLCALFLVVLLIGGCSKKISVSPPVPSPSPETESNPGPTVEDELDPSLIIQEALQHLVSNPETDRQKSVDLLTELLAGDPKTPYREQADLILELVKKLELLEEDLEGREAAVQQLSRELEAAKEIILREKATRPPR